MAKKSQPQLPLEFGRAKTCTHCNSHKPIERFYLSMNSKDGHRPTCIDCWRVINKRTPEQNREYRARNLESIRERDRERIKPHYKTMAKAKYDRRRRAQTKEEYRSWKLKSSYGISLEDYNVMHKDQGGLCAICSNPETRKANHGPWTKRLAVDHCHASGRVRGLLCQDCNTAIGLLRDDAAIAASANRYLFRANEMGD
jgi:hypothetical protein